MTPKPTSLRLDPQLREQVARAAYWLRMTQTEFIAEALQAAVDQAAAELGGTLDPLPPGAAIFRGITARPPDPTNRHDDCDAMRPC